MPDFGLDFALRFEGMSDSEIAQFEAALPDLQNLVARFEAALPTINKVAAVTPEVQQLITQGQAALPIIMKVMPVIKILIDRVVAEQKEHES
jgi:N-acetylglucosamine kinase-like BadF-type ATPase